MKIEYWGHSCFKLTNNGGTSVVCDPYSEEVGFSMPKVEADAVTVSHGHFDHCATENVLGNPVIFSGAGEHNISGIEIIALKSFHDNAR